MIDGDEKKRGLYGHIVRTSHDWIRTLKLQFKTKGGRVQCYNFDILSAQNYFPFIDSLFCPVNQSGKINSRSVYCGYSLCCGGFLMLCMRGVC